MDKSHRMIRFLFPSGAINKMTPAVLVEMNFQQLWPTPSMISAMPHLAVGRTDLTAEEKQEVRASIFFYLAQMEANNFEMPPLDMLTLALYDEYYQSFYHHAKEIPDIAKLKRAWINAGRPGANHRC